MEQVLDFMPASYIRVIRRVCRGWCDAAARFITRVKPEQFNAALLLCRFPHLQALHLSHCSMAMVTRSKCDPAPAFLLGKEGKEGKKKQRGKGRAGLGGFAVSDLRYFMCCFVQSLAARMRGLGVALGPSCARDWVQHVGRVLRLGAICGTRSETGCNMWDTL